MPERPPQITLQELLEDPLYKKWIQRVPKFDDRSYTHTPGWVVYALTADGKWHRKLFSTYVKAFNWMAKHRKQYKDMCLGHRRHEFNPPIVKTMVPKRVRLKSGKVKTIEVEHREYWRKFPPDHRWCGYCRRPTIFFTFRKHHAVPLQYMLDYVPRCTMCGAKGDFVNDPYNRRPT